MSKQSRRRKARDRAKPSPLPKETPVYNEEPPQAESPVYDDSGAPPFPNPAAAVAPPQPALQFSPEVLAQAARFLEQNRPIRNEKTNPVAVEFAQTAIGAMSPVVDPVALMKKEHADMVARINAMQHQFEQLKSMPIGPLTQAAAFVLDGANFVVQEYAKIGRTVTLQQAVNLIVHTVAAAQRGNLADLLAVVAPGK